MGSMIVRMARRWRCTVASRALATALVVSSVAMAHPAAAQDVQEPSGDPDERVAAAPVAPPDASLPVIEPIITDEEFDEAIPDLSPQDDVELLGPLESIEEFERRLASDQADAAPTEGEEAPLGDPALADGDLVEEIGDAPVRDAELVAPLPPIESFDVVPVEFAEAESEGDLVDVAYQVRIEGLEGADGDSDRDLRGLFSELSSLEGADGSGANIAQVNARLTEDAALLQRIMASEGWYDASVVTRIDRADGPDGQPLTAVLAVTPGTRFVFSDIVVTADATVPPDLIRENLALQVGEPVVAERVQGAEANVAIALPQNGYPFAVVGQRDILIDLDEGNALYTLPVETGPRSSFGGIVTSGELAFDVDHIGTLARFERGELYNSDDVDDLRQALIATGLFETIAVTPQRSGEFAPDGTEYATISVEQTAGPPRTIAASAGYGTGEGFRVEGSWTHRNLFPPEGALIAYGLAGTLEQGAGVTFRRSNAGRRDRTFTITAEVLRSDYDAFQAYTGQLSALVSYDSTPIWRKPFTYAYGVRLIGTNEQDFNLTRGVLDRRTFGIFGLTGQAGFDRTDSLLDPTRGFRATVLLEPEGSLQGGFSPYIRARGDVSAYYPVSDALVVAGRLRLGTIQGIERFDLAPSRRFYGGGGGSVRGFGFQDLGPKIEIPNPDFDPADPEEEDDPTVFRPLGGRSMAEAALEVRYRFGNFGVVGFVDAGQIYESSFPGFDDIRFGAGIGGRYYTNFGPLRLDVAMPLARRPGESSFSVYVSIGQAF